MDQQPGRARVTSERRGCLPELAETVGNRPAEGLSHFG